MTYAELASARGISAASAEHLARRRHWKRQRGNDGLARVLVPEGEDRPPQPRPRRKGPMQSPISPPASGAEPRADIGPYIAQAIREAIAPIREQLDHERARADRAEQRAEALQGRIEALLARTWWQRLRGRKA